MIRTPMTLSSHLSFKLFRNITWQVTMPVRSLNTVFLKKPHSLTLNKSWSGKAAQLSSLENPGLQTLQDVAGFIRDHACTVLVMAGAGMSTPSGIPDFRSPGTGLYDNLQKYNLPYPEAIFDIHYFMMDSRPFMALAQELYPGRRYKPNAAHYFLRLLNDKQKLLKVYTQNIDGLERLAGVPGDKLMEAHGSFASASCTLCGRQHDKGVVERAIEEGVDAARCLAPKCKGKVKPDIVFFGENLPHDFWSYREDVHFCDLLLVIGTSLEVYPFAGIADAVGRYTPRVLVNREPAGTFGCRPGDVILTGDLEHCVKELVREIGWEDDLKNLMKEFDVEE